jgi:porin
MDSDIWTRSVLTGDWCGARYTLQECGISFAVRETQFAFGIAGGINTPIAPPMLGLGNTFAYTGRGEYDAIFDLEKLAELPKGSSFLVRLENWYGQYGNVSLRAGTFTPPVFPALLPTNPNQPGVPILTNFFWTQPVSKQLVLFAGQKDVLGSADQNDFAGGDGTSQFVNQALIANPAFLLGLPYTSFTAGFVSPQKWGRVGAFVRDPTNRTDSFFLDRPFAQGVIVGAEVRLDTNFFSLPGEQHVGGVWKHLPLTNLRFEEPPPGVYPEPTVPGFPTINDSYTLYYGFDQYLVQFSGSKRGWGLFGRASISDGNPTPLQYFLSAGLGGDSPFRQRQGDTFGVGWYEVGASNQFGPLPRALFGPRNGSGVELFYNFQVTPWCNVSPDFQFLHPGAGAIAENGFVYGVRLNVIF